MCGVIYSRTYMLSRARWEAASEHHKTKKVKAAAFLWPFRGGSALLYFRIGKEREKRKKGKIIQIQFPPFPKPWLILEYISLFSQISPSFSAFSKARVYIKESSVLSCTFNRLNVGCRSLNQVQAIALN